jgi:2-oxoglutarate ferredoxin oxidoreductase subunit gamma
VVQPNILLTLTQEAYNSFSALIRPGGLLLSDPRSVQTTKKADAKKLELPMYEQVLEKRIPKDFLAMNHRSLDIGLVLGAQYQYKIFK